MKKKLTPTPQGFLVYVVKVQSALLALLHREKETPQKKAFFCDYVGILDCTISICIVLDRLNPKNNQKKASMTILKIRCQVRSASYFNLLFLLLYCLVHPLSLIVCYIQGLLCLVFILLGSVTVTFDSQILSPQFFRLNRIEIQHTQNAVAQSTLMLTTQQQQQQNLNNSPNQLHHNQDRQLWLCPTTLQPHLAAARLKINRSSRKRLWLLIRRRSKW